MVSVDDLQSAVGSLRAEVPGILTQMLGQFRNEVMEGFKEINDRSITEIATQVQILRSEVEAHHKGFGAAVEKSVDDRFMIANKAFVVEQERLSASFANLQSMIQQVSDAGTEGGMDRFIALLKQQEKQMEAHTITVANVVHETLKNQVNTMDGRWNNWAVKTDARLGAFDSAGFNGPPGVDKPARGGYQLRVPDPKMWQLDTLKDGNHGFAKWRKGFDLQVDSIWNGLGNVLEEMRRDDNVIDAKKYNEYMLDLDTGRSIMPAGASDLDWAYQYVSTKLYMLIYNHCDVDPIKIIEESSVKLQYH